MFSPLFRSQKMHLWSVSPLEPFYKTKWLISLPFYASSGETSNFSYTCDKGTSFGWSLPVQAIIGSTLPPGLWFTSNLKGKVLSNEEFDLW